MAVTHKDYNDDVFVDSLLYVRRINGYMDSYIRNLVQLRLEEGSRLHSVQISRVKFVRIISFIGINSRIWNSLPDICSLFLKLGNETHTGSCFDVFEGGTGRACDSGVQYSQQG